MRIDWIQQGRVAAMGAPWPEDIPALRESGVRAVVSLTVGIPDGLRESFDHLHLPVRDFTPPSQKQLRAGVLFMDAAIEQGGAVLVHCAAGYGRTGTLIAAWLVHHGAQPEQAIRRIRTVRPGSVETPAQEQAIALFSRIDWEEEEA